VDRAADVTRVQLTPSISVPDDAVRLAFVRSSGPGGQNVNKVSTAVELRLDLDAAGLAPALRARLERIVGSKLTQANEIVIFAQRHRTQKANRDDAFARLAELVRRAERPPKRRIATAPTFASKRARLARKDRHASLKKLRGKPSPED
jgi:ribosome-associated protein